jgi:purine-binding chemotaxis protein CheW
MSTTRQFCTFHLGTLYLGVEVLKVQEVIRHQPMTRVPLAPPTVRGLINLRGQIVLAVDLRRRLELPPAEPPRTEPPMNVVVRDDDSAVSLLVDEIGDVVEVEDSRFEPPPETLQGVARELVAGVFPLKDRLLLILDTLKITTLTHRN